MDHYRVELDAYSGPLDLLLYLVRRHEIDLHDIPIAQLTQQYLEHLELIQKIDVELASEFLVMAATLLEIKSATLLPKPPADPDAPLQELAQADPRYELVQQLLAYKRFKDASASLERRRQIWEQRYPVHPVQYSLAHDPAQPGQQAQPDVDLEDVHVMDLFRAYCRVLESVGQQPGAHQVIYDDTPITLHAEDILDRLGREGAISLQEMFVGRSSRGEKIGLFLATLELVRQSKITIAQDDASGQIRLELGAADPGNPAPEPAETTASSTMPTA